MKFRLVSLILAGFLAMPWLSYASAQPIKNSPTVSTSHLATSATATAGKSKICHFVNDPDFPQMFSVVIDVNDHSLDAHFAHGDCFTEAPKGSKNCTCEPPPVISSFTISCSCIGSDITWTSTGGTSAVLERLDDFTFVVIQSYPVSSNGSLSTILGTFRLVVTGPGGTVISQKISCGFDCQRCC